MSDPMMIVSKSGLEMKAHGRPDFPIGYLSPKLSDYPSSFVKPHWHPVIEVSRVLEGGMRMLINHETFYFQEGDCVVINKNAVHSQEREHEDCRYEVFNFNPVLVYSFEGSAIERKYVTPILESAAFPFCRFTGHTPAHQRVLALMDRMRDQFFSEVPCSEILLKNTISELWIELYQRFTELVPKLSDDRNAAQIQRLKNALTFIYEHYSEPITLDQMVAACYANKSAFCRMFKATLHQTPFDFLLHYRIQQSLPLLSRPELTITEIATTVGFSGASYYSEVFRKYMSCSPSQYRKQLQQDPAE